MSTHAMSMTSMSSISNGMGGHGCGAQSMATNGSTAAAAVVTKARPKKVEVRWLESESEMYLKQWQHRYHQLVGLDDEFDDMWYNGSSAKTLLDLELDFPTLNAKNNNNFISSSNTDSGGSGGGGGGHNRSAITTFDHIFWSTDDHLVKNNKANSKSNKRFKKSLFGISSEPMLADGPEFARRRRNMAAAADDESSDGEDNDSFENMRLTSVKRFVNKSNNNNKKNNRNNKNDIVFNEKERQFSIDLNKRLELLAKDQAALTNGVDAAIDETVLKARQPKTPRGSAGNGGGGGQRDRSRPPRPRPPPIRRQIFKCEHIGCSYQSDRNFNFLRHKRTHRKTNGTAGADGCGGDDSVSAAAANGVVKVLTNLCVAVKSSATGPTIHGLTTLDHHIINGGPNPKLYITQTSNTSDTVSSTMSSSSQLSITTSGSIGGSTASADDLNTLLLMKATEPLMPTTTAMTATTAVAVDCLKTSCDTTDDNIKLILNNNNNTKCDVNNHSYHHQNPCLD